MPNSAAILLNKNLAQKLWDQVDNFLFDCDGVIWNWPHKIPGSIEFINKAKEMGKKCYFVTNNSTRTRETFSSLLKQMGILNVEESEIVSTAWVLAEHLKSTGFKDKVYLIGNEAMIKELDKADIKHSALDENKDYHFNSANYQDIKLDSHVKCVAIGYDFEFDFQKMIFASSYAQKSDCLFLATNDDNCIPTGSQQILIPDAGAILASIEKTTGKKATVIGKPNAIMWQTLSKFYNLDPKRTCMIGDRMDTVLNFLRIFIFKIFMF